MRSKSWNLRHFSRSFKHLTICLPTLPAIAASLFLLGGRSTLTAQIPLGQSPQPGSPLGIPDASGHPPGDDQRDPQQREILEKLALRRNIARQQQLVKDTDKLLALATELKTQVDQTNKNVLSIDVIRKAEEIEKLARTVKDRMKN